MARSFRIKRPLPRLDLSESSSPSQAHTPSLSTSKVQVTIRAANFYFGSILLITFSILLSTVFAETYQGPLVFVFRHGEHTVEYSNWLANVLKDNADFGRRYDQAVVKAIPADTGRRLFTDQQLETAVRQAYRDKAFVLLGPPHPGVRRVGFATAMPIKNNAIRPNDQLFAYVAFEHARAVPVAYIRGFGVARNVAGVVDHIQISTHIVSPYVANERGHIRTLEEVIHELPGGWMG